MKIHSEEAKRLIERISTRLFHDNATRAYAQNIIREELTKIETEDACPYCLDMKTKLLYLQTTIEVLWKV